MYIRWAEGELSRTAPHAALLAQSPADGFPALGSPEVSLEDPSRLARAFCAIRSSCVDMVSPPLRAAHVPMKLGGVRLPAASPWARLSRARSAISGSDLPGGIRAPQVPCLSASRTRLWGKTAEGLPSFRSLCLPPCRAHAPRRGLRRPRLSRPPTVAFQPQDPVGPRFLTSRG
jgi:hypothetical protein